MSAINIKQLDAFVRVADLGSFRKAAVVLKTTQPNISTRIARLEEQLGQTLFERDAGSVRLTPVGARLLDKARDVLNGLDDFIVSANAPALFDGTLRLGVTEMVVHSWLSDYLGALRMRFPNIKVELTADLSINLSEALFKHSIDLTLQSGPFSQRTRGDVVLETYAMVWVASPALAPTDQTLDRAALCRHPILTHARQTQPFRQLEQHLKGDDAYLVPSTSLGACLRMTLDGLGIACLPSAMVSDEIKNGRLVSLNYQWVPDDLVFSARYHVEKAPHHLKQAAHLAKEIAQRFEQRL